DHSDDSRVTGMTLIIIATLAVIPISIGLLTMISWCRPCDPPMDNSNRINRIVLWWLVLTKPHLFVGPWRIFRMDVEDQVRAIGETDHDQSVRSGSTDRPV